jgi:phosphoglycolate phosphatase-like HAD superfamily hydrolase
MPSASPGTRARKFGHPFQEGIVPKCFIIDIDGTIADASHRLHHIQNKPKNWDAFFEGCEDDVPIPAIEALLHHLTEGRAELVYVTGRPERLRDATLAWFGRHELPVVFSNRLYMRADGDHRPDTIVKRELLSRLRADGWEPVMAFEDRASVVQMWRDNGVPCAQVVEGNY